MSTEQCWPRDPTGSRCPQPAVRSSHFCASHRRRGPPNPLTVLRAPEAEMPPDLLAAIRRYQELEQANKALSGMAPTDSA